MADTLRDAVEALLRAVDDDMQGLGSIIASDAHWARLLRALRAALDEPDDGGYRRGLQYAIEIAEGVHAKTYLALWEETMPGCRPPLQEVIRLIREEVKK